MNITLKLIGLLGVVLFGFLFSVTYVSPERIEESARGFVKFQIETEVREKQQSIKESSVTAAALRIADKLGFEKEQIQNSLDTNLAEKIAAIIASMCGYDCEKKKALAQSITTGYLEKIKSIQIAERTLSDIVKGKYLQIVSNLKHDLRIFFGANLMIFIVLLIVSFAKPKAVAHLFLPGMLLASATILSSLIYIFGQDWFYTILYNDYMGYGYLAYLAVIFGFLLDIVLNRGQVTTEIINGLANLVGSVSSLTPC